LKQDSWLNFEFFLACELKMTVSKLRTELTDAELVHFAAYYQLKGEREERAMDRAKMRRR
jgi:hypothetical protein|tara:strand:- start:876 stop:1055 length:180 start_codon:yes stop_codon:yes gene_type:complete